MKSYKYDTDKRINCGGLWACGLDDRVVRSSL